MNPVVWLVRLLAPLAAGIHVPWEALPRELAMLGNLLPQTYVVSAARKALLKGAALGDVAGELFTLTLQAAVLIPVGAALLAHSLSLERKRATMY